MNLSYATIDSRQTESGQLMHKSRTTRPCHTGQPHIPTAMVDGERFVLHAKQVPHRGVQIIDLEDLGACRGSFLWRLG